MTANPDGGEQGPVASKDRAVLVLLNPNGARASLDLSKGLDLLKARGFQVDVVACRSADDMRRRLTVERDPGDLIVIGGGDGTLNGLAEALVASGRPLGILPLGTANDLARSLGIPVDPAGACQIIADGCTRTIDLGWVGAPDEAPEDGAGKLFFNVASLGAAVEVSRVMAERRHRNSWLGVFSYPLALMAAVRRARPFTVRVRVDGREQVLDCRQLSVGNGLYYGGGMRVSECAALDDHLLDVYAVTAAPLWRIARHLADLRAGRHGAWDEVVHLRGQEVEVQTVRPKAINTDGEVTARTPAVFRVLPGALRVIVPAEGAEALRDPPGPADGSVDQKEGKRP